MFENLRAYISLLRISSDRLLSHFFFLKLYLSTVIFLLFPGIWTLLVNHEIYFSFVSFLKFILLKYSWFTILCQLLPYSKVSQLHNIYILFKNILFHVGLSQDIEYGSLGRTVGPCYFFTLYIIVCICSSQPSTPSLLQTPSPLATTSLFSIINHPFYLLPMLIISGCHNKVP